MVFIALTFGANQHRLGLAAPPPPLRPCWSWQPSASLIRAPLARVPENAMKFGVGVMLTSFGIFWGAEGAGANWPGGDAALLVLVPAVLVFSLLLLARIFRPCPRAGVRRPRRERDREAALLGSGTSSSETTGSRRRASSLALGLTALISERHAAWFVMPLAVAFLLALSIWRERARRRR